MAWRGRRRTLPGGRTDRRSVVLAWRFVVAANAWMKSPAGFTLMAGRPADVSPLAAMANPAWKTEAIHIRWMLSPRWERPSLLRTARTHWQEPARPRRDAPPRRVGDQRPYLVRPDLPIFSSAASPEMLRLLLIILAVGGVFLVPSIYLLLRVFKKKALFGG